MIVRLCGFPFRAAGKTMALPLIANQVFGPVRHLGTAMLDSVSQSRPAAQQAIFIATA